jgi:hypothetical protein
VALPIDFYPCLRDPWPSTNPLVLRALPATYRFHYRASCRNGAVLQTRHFEILEPQGTLRDFTEGLSDTKEFTYPRLALAYLLGEFVRSYRYSYIRAGVCLSPPAGQEFVFNTNHSQLRGIWFLRRS